MRRSIFVECGQVREESKMTWKLLESMTKKIMVKLIEVTSSYLKVMSEDQKRDQD